MTLVLSRAVAKLPAGFDILRAEARVEGHTHMERLANEWAAGVNRFNGPNEALLAAFVTDELAGVGGLSRDPHCPTALRLRRFYVRPRHRRQGIGRHLGETLLARAMAATGQVVLNAGSEVAARFWEAMGFVHHFSDGHTHRLTDWDGRNVVPASADAVSSRV